MQGRLAKEIKEIQDSKLAGVQAHFVDGNSNHWKGIIMGPSDTPYQNGTYIIDIVIPPNYPFVPPKMKFDTKIWHPNISSQTGAICLDILKDEWSPALTIRTALLSLQALLCAPVPEDPQDGVVAAMYKKDINEFNRTAKEWTEKYALNPEIIHQEKIARLADMGFDKEKCKKILEKHGWNEQQALESLLSG